MDGDVQEGRDEAEREIKLGPAVDHGVGHQFRGYELGGVAVASDPALMAELLHGQASQSRRIAVRAHPVTARWRDRNLVDQRFSGSEISAHRYELVDAQPGGSLLHVGIANHDKPGSGPALALPSDAGQNGESEIVGDAELGGIEDDAGRLLDKAVQKHSAKIGRRVCVEHTVRAHHGDRTSVLDLEADLTVQLMTRLAG